MAMVSSSKAPQKPFCKKVVSKGFYKKIDKNPNSFSLSFLLSRSGVFLGEVKTTTNKFQSKKN
jgi:hypothetical protein